ncbi:hypothetical protein [Nocardia tengchongensis]|uniref:hypothetical protein n=1 Tax=Nocardia tengchongensis TaxID=2055889 RepID=UPI003620761E
METAADSLHRQAAMRAARDAAAVVTEGPVWALIQRDLSDIASVTMSSGQVFEKALSTMAEVPGPASAMVESINLASSALAGSVQQAVDSLSHAANVFSNLQTVLALPSHVASQTLPVFEDFFNRLGTEVAPVPGIMRALHAELTAVTAPAISDALKSRALFNDVFSRVRVRLEWLREFLPEPISWADSLRRLVPFDRDRFARALSYVHRYERAILAAHWLAAQGDEPPGRRVVVRRRPARGPNFRGSTSISCRTAGLVRA